MSADPFAMPVAGGFLEEVEETEVRVEVVVHGVREVLQPVPGGAPRTWMVVTGVTEDGREFEHGWRTYREPGASAPPPPMPEPDTARRAREKAEYVHPEPEVRARPAEPGEVPRGAKAIITPATAAGFELAVTYARGTMPPKWEDDPEDTAEREPDPETGEVPKRRRIWTGTLVETILVRGKRADDRRFAATWVDGKSDAAFVFGADRPIERVSATDLKSYLKEIQ